MHLKLFRSTAMFLTVSLFIGCPPQVTVPIDAGTGGGFEGGQSGGVNAGGAGGNTGGGSPQVGGGSGGSGGGAAATDGGFTASSKANLRFKGPERISNDFSAALSLAPGILCNEFGLYSCTAAVHTLALGGYDAYGNGVYEAPTLLGVTAPLVVDRVALAGCSLRAGLDVLNPAQAEIFKNIPLKLTGGIRDPQAPEVTAAIETLYKRALQRMPTTSEKQRLSALILEIEAAGSTAPALDWMKTACFSVLSSSESILY